MKKLFNKLTGTNAEPTLSDEQREVLLASLNATDAYERVMAAKLLGEAREITAVEGLLKALTADFADRSVAQMQTRGDQGAGSVEAYRAMALIQELIRAQSELRQTAAQSLGLIAERHRAEAKPISEALIPYLRDRDYYFTLAVRNALDRANTPESRAALDN